MFVVSSVWTSAHLLSFVVSPRDFSDYLCSSMGLVCASGGRLSTTVLRFVQRFVLLALGFRDHPVFTTKEFLLFLCPVGRDITLECLCVLFVRRLYSVSRSVKLFSFSNDYGCVGSVCRVQHLGSAVVTNLWRGDNSGGARLSR